MSAISCWGSTSVNAYPSEDFNEIGSQGEKLGHALWEVNLADAVVVCAAAVLELQGGEGWQSQSGSPLSGVAEQPTGHVCLAAVMGGALDFLVEGIGHVGHFRSSGRPA